MADGSVPALQADAGYTPDLGRMRKWFTAYEANKDFEIKERQEALAYYHGIGQWSEAERKKLKKRGQAPIFDNRIGRKIDFLVGVEQRMRRDPKAYPRTPNDEQSADVATAGMRYACDINRWEFLGSSGTHDGLVEGIGVLFVGIKPCAGGLEPEMKHVQADRFFYDPRSVRPDFEDAKYMGLYLWMDVDDAKAKWPEKADQIENLMDNSLGNSLSISDQNHQTAWAEFETRRVRVVEFWEKRMVPAPMSHPALMGSTAMTGNRMVMGWAYCNFVGEVDLESGVSPYIDEEGKPDCPYVAWSPYIDERGNRYGPIRNMKPMQDEINHRRSKFLHLNSTKQIHARTGALADVDEARRQFARPDGIIQHDGAEWGKDVGIIDHSADIQGQSALLEQAQAALENLGPNPGLIGKGAGIADQSGRAILAQRDSGMTELSPVFERNRDWKLRVYRKLWARCKQAWTAEKWIRITDENDAPQFIGLNQYGMDPQTGQMMSQNVVAQIDVDIIMEEGPDVITMNEELLQTLSQLGPNAVPPKVLIELSNAPNKDRLFKMIDEATQPDPMVAQMQQRMARLEQLVQASTVDKNVAQSELWRAQAAAALMKASTPEAPKPAGTDPMGNPLPSAPPQMPNLAMADQFLRMFPFHYSQPTIEQFAEGAPPPQPPADPEDQQQSPMQGAPQQQLPPPGPHGGLPVNPQLAGM